MCPDSITSTSLLLIRETCTTNIQCCFVPQQSECDVEAAQPVDLMVRDAD